MLGCKLAAMQQESSPKLNIILMLLKLLIALDVVVPCYICCTGLNLKLSVSKFVC